VARVEPARLPAGREDAFAAREHVFGGALDVCAQLAGLLVDRGHQPQRRVEVELPPPPCCARREGGVGAQKPGGREQRDLGRVARGSAAFQLGVVARGERRRQPRDGRRPRAVRGRA
jgi:hypothetical protein